ncbi:MAG: hypothetical protein C0475_01265 [Planctomyces sp.]|nr:hypothetical protein [Planctomyces sp.]
MHHAHAIVTTHTTRHLRRTLLGVTVQSPAVRSVTVTIDGDDPSIAGLVASCAQELGVPIIRATRAHTGVCRSAQARNNGVRALLAALRPAPAGGDALAFFDGDCAPARDCVAALQSLLGLPRRRRGLAISRVVYLSQQQTDAFDEAALRAGRWPAAIEPEALARLRGARRSAVLASWLRPLRLTKPHKPKLMSGLFAVTLEAFGRVNGFDEAYAGYGQEDDDLGRRLMASGSGVGVGIGRAMAFHQWHPTRHAGPWEGSPGIARFRGPWSPRARDGLETPVAQPHVHIDVCMPDGSVARHLDAPTGPTPTGPTPTGLAAPGPPAALHTAPA